MFLDLIVSKAYSVSSDETLTKSCRMSRSSKQSKRSTGRSCVRWSMSCANASTSNNGTARMRPTSGRSPCYALRTYCCASSGCRLAVRLLSVQIEVPWSRCTAGEASGSSEGSGEPSPWSGDACGVRGSFRRWGHDADTFTSQTGPERHKAVARAVWRPSGLCTLSLRCVAAEAIQDRRVNRC